MAPENQNVDELLEQARAELTAASSSQELSEVRARYLGKKGSVSGLLRTLGKLEPEERKRTGAAVNAAKQAIEAQVAECRDALEGSARERSLAETQLDVSLPGAAPRPGHLHPLTHVTRDMVNFFSSMGFSSPDFSTIS